MDRDAHVKLMLGDQLYTIATQADRIEQLEAQIAALQAEIARRPPPPEETK